MGRGATATDPPSLLCFCEARKRLRENAAQHPDDVNFSAVEGVVRPLRAGDRLSPGGPGSLDVLLAVHGAVGSWGRHRTVQGMWTYMAH